MDKLIAKLRLTEIGVERDRIAAERERIQAERERIAAEKAAAAEAARLKLIEAGLVTDTGDVDLLLECGEGTGEEAPREDEEEPEDSSIAASPFLAPVTVRNSKRKK